METKTAQAIRHYRNGDIQKALAIAKTFRSGISHKEKSILVRGYETFSNPKFYEALGYNIIEQQKEAIKIFEKCFVK
jgi:hypothetical protein